MKREEIEQYVVETIKNGKNFNLKHGMSLSTSNQKTKKNNILYSLQIFKSFIDYIYLLISFSLNKKKLSSKNIIYFSTNLCTNSNDGIEISLLNPLKLENNIFINHSKENYLSKIQGQKVYNFGLLTNILYYLSKKNKSELTFFNCYQKINEPFLRKLNRNTVYTLCHYDINGLSIVFSKYREKFTLAEIQHGSIINFYPYKKPINYPIIDLFYIRNKATEYYLKENKCKYYDAKFIIIQNEKLSLIQSNDVTILYASSIETNGIHPVFLNFLNQTKIMNLNVFIRLHPREKNKTELFKNITKKLNLNITIDESKFWLENKNYKNLIVISPWSSIIEEAIEYNIRTIIIDKNGEERYNNYIDDNICFYKEKIEDEFILKNRNDK